MHNVCKKEEIIECEGCGRLCAARDVVRFEDWLGERHFCKWCYSEMNDYFVSAFDNDIHC